MRLKLARLPFSVLLFVLLHCSTHALNKPWIMGGSIGYGQTIGHITVNHDNQRFASFRPSASGILGELVFGYGVSVNSFNSVYLGIEASGILDSTDNKQVFVAPAQDSKAQSSIFIKHPGQIGLSGILGYNLSLTSKVFLGLGLYWNTWKLTYKGNDPSDRTNQYSSKTKSAFVLTPSLGLETSIGKDTPWFIRSTFRYNMPTKINFSTEFSAMTALLFNKSAINGKFGQCQFLVSLIYRFGPKSS